ncbi:unnamed protein product [Gongylonema pulchrum]|uniref:PD40 domain-containing protein n=1 Tax=Gongylonema pulchrum TaxID=637853 RepID=A0A183CZ05_9BILA|nr:unnamed protein product [Gongylonema pulchrum]
MHFSIFKNVGAVWGRAWEENGKVRALCINRHSVKILDKGFRLLLYRGTPDTNGYKFAWVRVKDVDRGTILFTGPNMHAPAVFSEDGQFEYLGDADISRWQMEFVKYGSDEPHTVANYGATRYFDDDVYVLTKQRCHCQC